MPLGLCGELIISAGGGLAIGDVVWISGLEEQDRIRARLVERLAFSLPLAAGLSGPLAAQEALRVPALLPYVDVDVKTERWVAPLIRSRLAGGSATFTVSRFLR